MYEGDLVYLSKKKPKQQDDIKDGRTGKVLAKYGVFGVKVFH